MMKVASKQNFNNKIELNGEIIRVLVLASAGTIRGRTFELQNRWVSRS